MKMISGKTSSGFEFELPENVINNMELVDALAESSDTDMLSVSRVVRLLLDKDQRQRLYDHVRAEDGRVPIDAVSEEVAEIFQAFSQPGKN